MRDIMKIFVIGAACISLTGCRVNKTQEAKLPEVNVTTTKGQLPHYNIEGPKVDVGSKKETIDVPTVHIKNP